MFEELTHKLLDTYSEYQIHYFSIGCGESITSTVDPKYVCQQFPLELQNRSENMCLYLIDNNLQPITYVETHLIDKGYVCTSEVKIVSINNSCIKVFKNYKNTIQLVILRSNDIYTYDYLNDKYIMPEQNFDFFSLMISLIYENYSIGIFQTYSGQHLKIIDKYCKLNGYCNRILVGITCGRDFSCYVPDTFLNKIQFKTKLGNLCIKNPDCIPNFCMRDKFLKYGIESDYGKQILYIMNNRIFSELRLIANLLDFVNRRIQKNENVILSEISYYSEIPDYELVKDELKSSSSTYNIKYLIAQIFENQVRQCQYFLPEDLRRKLTVEDIEVSSIDPIPCLNFVNKMYSDFKNVYPLDKIEIIY
jgi:hypothetical protein